MALATASGLAPFDITGIREDLSDLVAEILLGSTTFLSRVGISGEATNTTHDWLERSLNAITVTDSGGALTSSATTLTVVTGQGSRLRIGALLRDEAQGKTEVIQVTNISTDTITIVRGFGTSSDETHAASAVFRILGRPKQDGADLSTDRSTTRTKVTNFTQIFEDAVIVAGAAEAVLKAGVPSEVGLQGADRLIELMRELDNSIMLSYKSADAGSDTSYRSMNGLLEFLLQTDANKDNTQESLTEGVLNDMFRLAFDDGGDPSLILLNQKQMEVMSGFNADKIRIVPGINIAGNFVSHFITDLGKELEVVLDRWFPNDTVAILDQSRITVMPLKSRAFGISPIAPTGDAIKRQLLGEYTLEVRNAKEAHSIHTNLNIPS